MQLSLALQLEVRNVSVTSSERKLVCHKLFCLTIHPLVSQLRSEFKVFYLDDGTLGGSVESVLRDLQQLEIVAAELGLQLNHQKSELICDDVPTKEAMLLEILGLRSVHCSNATLLGTPIGSEECINDIIREKAGMLELMGDRLSLLPSHDALLLLRHSFAILKVLYLVRTAPCFLSPELRSFDDLLRHLLSSIVNIPLSDESAWLQATLPVRAQGIGIRRAVQLAPSAYLASAAGCSELVQPILPPRLHSVIDPHADTAINLWQHGHDHPPPSLPASHSQRVWDCAIIESTFNSLLDTASDQQSRARLLATSCPESGAGHMNALPVVLQLTILEPMA